MYIYRRFKALQHIVSIYYNLHDMSQMVNSYRELLQYVTNTSITRNEVTDAINSVLDTVASTTDSNVLSKVILFFNIFTIESNILILYEY